MTVTGELKIAAISDLGGLGAKEGPPVTYHWTGIQMWPRFLPLVFLLLLMALKPNRRAQAWLILLPALFLGGLLFGLSRLEFLPSGDSNMFIYSIAATGFGVMTLWLASPLIERGNRFLGLLGMLGTIGLGSAIMTLSQTFSEPWSDLLSGFIILGIVTLITAIALSLASLFCRRRYSGLRYVVFLAINVVVIFHLACAPFFLVALFASGGGIDWSEFFIPVSIATGILFALLLPFLVLSFSSRFYGERWQRLLRQAPPPPSVPPVLPKPAAVSGEVGNQAS